MPLEQHLTKLVDEPSDAYEAFRIRTIEVPNPNPSIRQTPREIAKHVNQIHRSVELTDVECILLSMQQNSTESTLYMGCLGLGRLLTRPGELNTRIAVVVI